MPRTIVSKTLSREISWIFRVIALLALAIGWPPAMAADGELFLPPTQARAQSAAKPGHHPYRFNEAEASSLRSGQQTRLSLPRGVFYRAVLDRIERHGSGATTWINRLEDADDD